TFFFLFFRCRLSALCAPPSLHDALPICFSLRRRESEREGTRRVLLEGLSQTRALIAQAYQGFNDACDPDLIESYVFEINALQSRSEEHTSELQSRFDLVCRLLLEKKNMT